MASPQTLKALQILAGGPSKQQVLPTEDYGFAGATPTQGELSSPFEQEQTARANAANAADRAQVEKVRQQQFELSPLSEEIAKKQQEDKLKELLAVPQQQGQNAIALEKQKTQGALTLEQDKRAATQGLLETLAGNRGGGTGGGASPPGGPGSFIKPAINAPGGVSFSRTQTPAPVQRATNQFMAARDKDN